MSDFVFHATMVSTGPQIREGRVGGISRSALPREEHMTEKRPEIDSDSLRGALMRGDVVGIRDARLNQIIHEITEWARRRWTAEDSPNLVTYEIDRNSKSVSFERVSNLEKIVAECRLLGN